MVERFYDPDQGTVTLDGVDLKNYDIVEFRRNVGYVGQEPVLFNETIRENLKYGKPEATDQEIIAALRAANAWDFLEAQEGLDTNCGTGGNKLSGGQKQRIAIARAFIKKPKILIFDEATSALDKTNEAEVQRSIDGIRKELGHVTMIVIAHRLSTIKDSDQILVLKKGRIEEIGSHDTLLKDYPDGLYAKLVRTQEQADEVGEEQDSDFDLDEGAFDLCDITEGPKGNTSAYVINKETRSPTKVQDIDVEIKEEAINAEEEAEADALFKEAEKQTKMPSLSKKQSSKRRAPSAVKLAGGITKEEEEKHKEADEKDAEDNAFNDKKEKEMQSASFLQKLWPYTRPSSYVYLGFFISVVQGAQMPIFAIYIVKQLFTMGTVTPINEPPYYELDTDTIKEDTKKWCLAMLIIGIFALFTGLFQKFVFGIVGENIAMKMRQELYKSFLSKHQGWFDVRKHSPGSLSSTLATDAQIVNGAATEGIAVQMEATCSLLVGIIVGFVYSWKISLICLATVPFMVVASVIQA